MTNNLINTDCAHFLLKVIKCLALHLVRLFSEEQTNSNAGCSGNLFFSAGRLVSVWNKKTSLPPLFNSLLALSIRSL